MPTISIVIPCFNEQAVLPILYQRVRDAADGWDMEWELVLVDDGSRDKTWRGMLTLHQQDPRVKLLRFSRNFGHQTAVSAGLAHASGDCVAVLDADLQDPPEEVGRFLAEWRNGADVVYAVRTKRKERLHKRFCYWLFYRILAGTADIRIPLDSGDFCLMDRRVVDVITSMPERNRFVRGLRAWSGFKQVGVEYERQERAAGEAQYTFAKLVKLSLDGLLSFSTAPLRLTVYFGFLVAMFSFAALIFTVVQRLFIGWFMQHGFPEVPGYAALMSFFAFIGGVQLICIGIVGEYIGRIYDEVKKRPLWVISESRGMGEDGLRKRNQ